MACPEQLPIEQLEPESQTEGRSEEEIIFDETLNLEDYATLQREEALSDIIIGQAKKHYGHEPNKDEALSYYMLKGFNKDFAWRNIRHRSDITEERKREYYSSEKNRP